MKETISPDDWDRLFAPDAPRRGGPLKVFLTVLATLLIVGILGGGVVAGLQARATHLQNLALTPTALPTVLPTAQPTIVPTVTLPTIARGGNIRSAPEVLPTTVLGLVWPGDSYELLEERTVSGQRWLRIRVVTPGSNRGGEGVAANTEGWISDLLLTAP